MTTIKSYIEKNKDRFLSELFELLEIPSISSIPDHKEDMEAATIYWQDLLKKAGCDKVNIYQTDGNPIVYGEKIFNSSYPTVLVYGHMDVMPVDPLDEWDTQPFKPEIIDGKIYARGADDDKGQSFIHAKAFEYLVKTDLLKCNVKFIIEGEEEIGSPNLEPWCKKHKEMLKSDVILVSDTSMLSKDIPTITTGLRGICYWEIEVTGPNRDLHSGLFGGAVANPINILLKLIAEMVDDKGHITIPGFYDDVLTLSEKEKTLLSKAPNNDERLKKSLNLKSLFGEEGFSTAMRIGVRPTFDVCGIWGGYQGKGAKTVLPAKAYAKISSRLVPNQDYHKISQLFIEHINKITPDYVTIDVKFLHGGQAYVCPIDFSAYLAAEKAFKESYGKTPIPFRSGGSIPIISTFEKVLNTKTLLLGFGLDEDAIHSPNENFPLEQLFKGIETSVAFFKYYPDFMK